MGGTAVTTVDLSDVQGLPAYGYAKLVQASYLLLRVRNAEAARAWIATAPVATAEARSTAPDTALQLAFTPHGLRALGVPDAILAGFSPEFLNGMAGEPSRSRRLGDVEKNAPVNWLWGGPGKEPDLAALFFARQNLDSFLQSTQRSPWSDAFEILTTLDTSDLGGKEPFGFADGISQPEFDWKREQTILGTTVAYNNRVALGELLLGYPNEYGKYTDRPLLDPPADPANCLLPAEDQPSQRDLGRNGTYLVLRQLAQDIRTFWQYLDRAANGNTADRYRLGAAMVGRTVDGDPLIPESSVNVSGVTDQPGTPRNSFTYDGDPSAAQCPFGAHIRRANPRNADLFGHPSWLTAPLSKLGIPQPRLRDDLMASTRFHRVLRRGREYGPRLSPEDALQPPPANDPPRGLHFACLGANIGRQFEFVQNAWLMSTKFNGLSEESDPLLGNRAATGDCPVTGYFTIPREGQLPRRLSGIPQFITVRGGAYFFLPSLRALRFIARAGGAGSAG